MVTISKVGDSTIKFEFTNNDHYLYNNGEISVPLNSLILVTDDTDLVVFKKIDGDVFVTFLIGNSNFSSKDELVAWYKENMVDGGGSDITSGDVQNMIDESISGKADSSAVTEEISAAVSGKADTSALTVYFGAVNYDSNTKRINFYNETTSGDVLAYVDATDFIKDGMVDNVEIKTIQSGEPAVDVTVLAITFNSDAGKEEIDIPLADIFPVDDYWTSAQTQSAIAAAVSGKVDTSAIATTLTSSSTDSQVPSAKAVYDVIAEDEEVTAAALNTLNERVNEKADSSAVTQEISAAVSGKVDTSTYNTYTAATNAALSGKQDTLIAGENITISGNVISSEGGNNVVELTQAEYDALVSGGTVDPTAFYIITDAVAFDPSTKVDTSAFTAYSAATDTALSGKQDTLSAGTGIEISGNVISATGGGGGGKAIEAGRGIDITTGETADTVSISLPISAGTLNYSIQEGRATSAMSTYDHAEGYYTYANGNGYAAHAEGYQTSAMTYSCHAEGRGTKASGDVSHAEGRGTIASGDNSHAEGQGTKASGTDSHAEGAYTSASSVSNVSGINVYSGYQARHAEGCNTLANNASTHAEGYHTQANNFGEHASGVYNVSNSATTTYGDSGNTLFSVGNGTADNARHNAFEIRQNGDIYLTKDGQDIKLQDALGGGEVSSALTSGDTNAVQGGVLFNELRIVDSDELTLEWENNDGGSTTNYPSGNGYTRLDFYIDENEMTEGYFLLDSEADNIGKVFIRVSDGIIDVFDYENVTYTINGNVVTVNYPSIAANVAYLDSSYDCFWTVKAIKEVETPLINQVTANTAALGGLSIVKLTQSAYDALSPNYDNNTLYVIVN